MKGSASFRFFAGLWLAILLAAQVGQKVHIYCEDPAHFPAFSGDLVPDNGAREQVCERCIVDDFCFFPFLEAGFPAHVFYAATLCGVVVETTCRKLATAVRAVCLRAPPVLAHVTLR